MQELNLMIYISQIVLSIIILILVIVISSLKIINDNLQRLDLYSDKHNRKNNNIMKLTITKIGGSFSILFLIVACFIIFIRMTTFMTNNITEYKSLMPLISQENEVIEYKTDIKIEVIFFKYGDLCVKDGKCPSELSRIYIGLTYDIVTETCQMSPENDCKITIICYDCLINISAYVSLNMQEVSSYASAISVNVTSESSIPNEFSVIYQQISSRDSMIFRGVDPNEFYFAMTPSLFESDSESWPQNMTGYHVSLEKQPVYGSEYTITELAYTAGLKIKIYLNLQESCLYTLRSENYTLLGILGTLLGSIFGIMDAIGGFMIFFETTNSKITQKIQKSHTLKTMKANHYRMQSEF